MISPQRQFKDAIYEQLARIGKAVAAPRRIELLELLCQGPRTVEVLARQSGASVANASQHLRVLRAARLVESRKQGLYVEYRLADEQVGRFFLALRELASSRLPEVGQVTREYLEHRDGMEAIAADELRRRMKDGRVTVLDVRPREEYRAGHIPGAVSIPIGELEVRLDELPRGQEVVAYCRGPYCIMSIEAVGRLREQGFAARRMEEGVVEWRARGWRVEQGVAP